MQNVFFFNILVFISSIVIQSNKNFTLAVNIDSNMKNLHKALTLIVQKNFHRQTKKLVFYTYFDKNSAKHFYAANDIIDSVLGNILNYPYKILYNQEKVYSNLGRNEVVLVDSVNSFMNFYSKIKYMGNLDLSRTALFMPNLNSLEDEAIYFIFKELYYMEMLSVALVIMLVNGDILLLTYFPFTPEACDSFKPAIINRFLADEQRWEGNNYFPYKLQDLFGCPIYICTWEQVPYFKEYTNKGLKYFDGLEAEVLRFMAASLNASVQINWIDPVNHVVEDIEEFLSKVFALRCDLAMGGFAYRRDFDKTIFSQTRSIYTSHIYIVTNVIKFYTIYDKLAYPFHQCVWLAIGLTFAISILFIRICQWSRYRHFLIGSANNTAQFNLYTVAVGESITMNHLPKRNFARFLLTCWLLLTFILRCAYQSGMYQMLRDNKQWNPPQTIENVFEQKYLISTTKSYEKYLEVLPDTTEVRIFNTSVFEALEKVVAAKEPIAFLVPYEYYGHLHKINLTLWQNLHLVKERLMTQQLTMYSPHHSLLVPLFNKKLSYGHFHSLMSSWDNKNILPLSSALKYEHIMETGRSKNNNSSKNLLTMNELGAIFMILIWLHVIAVGGILCELIWYHYGNICKDWLLKRRTI